MTKIEWTETTVNVITGCTQYSEGCQNCYAKAMHKRLTAMGQEKYKEPFSVVKCHNIFSELSKKISKKINMCFINSMSDTFHKDVPDEYIKRLLDAVGRYGSKTQFQILTKRAERAAEFEYPDNVWLGVTVENNKYKDRIEFLKKTNAKIKFLSCEPLLEDLGKLDLSGINWVIVGGESGHNARPINPDWVRNIQRQCKEQGVAFFFKQWGEWANASQVDYDTIKANFKTALIGDSEVVLNTPIDKITKTYKFGRKYTGCKLDGKEYKEYPKWT